MDEPGRHRADTRRGWRGRRVGRVLKIALPVVLVAIVTAGVWLVFTGTRALAAVRDLQVAVDNVKIAVDETDLPALQQAANDAQDAATRADDALDGPLWAAVAAIPYLGDSAEVARVTAAALATASDGLTPLLAVADVFDPASLYADGRIDVDRLRAAQEPLAQAAAAVEEANDQISTAPAADDGAWVPSSLDSQRAEAAEQLDEATQALTTASDAASVMPALLGADGPRTWFVGIQSPAEARGTGGVIGTHVILTADDGRITFERSASNVELRPLETLPDFGPDFAARYGNDPALIGNTNLSPHFPYAGRLWQESYAQATGTRVDVVAGTDVVALGDLIEASGPITLPDGRRLEADEAVDFALKGVYTTYPDPAERKRFQEQVAAEVFAQVATGSIEPQAMATAIGSMVSENRLLLWSPDPTEQGVLLGLPTSGSVAAAPGPYAYPVVINSTVSKLDTYLTRDLTYEVGRCQQTGRVASRLRVVLESAIPPEATLPDYVIAEAVVGPSGPVSRMQLQVHLGPEAAVEGVAVDGEPATPYVFQEEGRTALVLALDLDPRNPETVTIDFNEPATDLPAVVPMQPLAQPAAISVVDAPCNLSE